MSYLQQCSKVLYEEMVSEFGPEAFTVGHGAPGCLYVYVFDAKQKGNMQRFIEQYLSTVEGATLHITVKHTPRPQPL